jgi:hypothetical protein
VIAEIERLLDNEMAGDPMSSWRWTHKTTIKISGQLQRLGIQVGARTVARLLGKLRFSLLGNRKRRDAIHRGARLSSANICQAMLYAIQAQQHPPLLFYQLVQNKPQAD